MSNVYNTDIHTIQLKRSKLYQSSSSTIQSPLATHKLLYGEPLLVEDTAGIPRFLIIGSSDTNDTTVEDEKVLRILPRKVTMSVNGVTTTYYVAQRGVFYKEKSAELVTLMNENADTLYPRTTVNAIDGLSETMSSKLNKPLSSTPGNIAVFDSTGTGVEDGGLSFSVVNGILRVTY